MNFAQVMVDALSLGSLYALIALGLGLLIGILRLINFAHGDFITIAAYALILPTADSVGRVFVGDFHWVLLVPVVCLVVVGVALTSDALVFRHLRTADPGTLMIASRGVSYFIQNAIMMVYGARPKGINLWPELNQRITLGDLSLPLLQLLIVGVTIVLVAGLTIFLRFTPWGIQVRAAASDFRMAQHLGVRGNFVISLTFAISGILAAIVGLLFITQTGALSYNLGVPLALFAFVASVVGGLGSLIGSVVGGYLIGIVMILLHAYLPSELRDFRDSFTFGLVLIILVLRPQGLFPSRTMFERV